MNLKSLIILILVIIAGGAAYFYIAAGSKKSAIGEDAWLVPNLAQNLNEVAKLTVHGAGNILLAEISKSKHHWVVVNRDHYEADMAVVRNAFNTLARARLIGKKTANPENYSKIEVEDISDVHAQGVQFSIEGLGEPIRVIAGKKGSLQDTQFVRRAGDAQSWLIDKKLDLNRNGAWWLRKDILDISPERIKSIRISHMDGGEVSIENRGTEDYEFTLVQAIPEGRKVSESELYQVANALSSLQLRDVASLQSFKEEILPSVITTFRMFDGLRVDARTFSDGKKTYVMLGIEFNEDHAAAQSDSVLAKEFAEKTKSRIEGWAFVLPTITQDAMVKRLEDILLHEDT